MGKSPLGNGNGVAGRLGDVGLAATTDSAERLQILEHVSDLLMEMQSLSLRAGEGELSKMLVDACVTAQARVWALRETEGEDS